MNLDMNIMKNLWNGIQYCNKLMVQLSNQILYYKVIGVCINGRFNQRIYR